MFVGLSVPSRQKKREKFGIQCYDTMLKAQLSRNEMISEFQEEAAKANQDAISFYNARKEKMDRTLKQFEEEEIRAKQTAIVERFLSGIKSIRGSLSSPLYLPIVDSLKSANAASFTGRVFLQWIDALLKCSSVCIQDLERILAICLQYDSNNCGHLQALLSEAVVMAEKLTQIVNTPIDGLSSAEMEAIGVSCSSLLTTSMGSRLVHQSVDRAKALLNEISTKLEAERQEKLKPATRPTKSIPVESSSEKSHLPYVEEAKAGVAWLTKLERSSDGLALPEEVSVSVEKLIDMLQRCSKSDSTSTNADEEAVSSSSMEPAAGASASLPDVVDILKALQDCLPAVIALGSGSYVKVFLSLMQVILREVQMANSESTILLYAALLTGVFESLPSSMVKESSKIVKNLFLSLSRPCLPDFLPPVVSISSGTSSAVKVCDEKSVRVLTLQSALIGRSPYIATPFTAEDGWTWLVKCARQLCFIQANGCSSYANAKSTLINNLCRCIRVTLKFAGFALYLRFQEKFTGLLTSITGMIDKCTEEEAIKLCSFVTKNKACIPPLYHDQQTPLALKAQELTSQLLITKNEVALIDSDKTQQIFETIRQHQIDRLRVIFNKLSATVESQTVAVSSLLEKLLIASKVSPELLRYTLFKISNNIISDSQEEVFNETDEGHPTKLARVSCGLCREIQDLSSVIQAQFYDQCPLTIPRNAKEGLVGEDFLLDLRLRKKKSGVWEDKQQWLTRMTKILATFSVIVIQPEQIPFSLVDGWRWLASLVNAACVSATSTPPFYVATALEVFLRIASPKMLSVYGDAFMQFLRAIQSVLLPRMNDDMPRRQCLQEFLQRFIDSNGNDFMTLFQR